MKKGIAIEIPEDVRKLASSYRSTRPLEFCTPANVATFGRFFESEAYEWHDEDNVDKMEIACRLWNVHLAADYVDQYLCTCMGKGHPLADLMVAQAFGTFVQLVVEHADNTETFSALGYLVQEVVSEAFVIRENGETLGSGRK